MSKKSDPMNVFGEQVTPGNMNWRTKEVDKISTKEGYGNRRTIGTSILRGINHRGYTDSLKSNVSNQGLTFFTRPDLNLSYDNVVTSRRLSNMNTKDKQSVPMYIRCVLDPVANNKLLIPTPYDHVPANVSSPLCDPKSPFIHVLSNRLTSLSGWPDFTIDSFTSEAGIAHEVWNQVDTYTVNYGTFDLTAEFREYDGGLVTNLFRVWEEYSARVADGSMMPYPWTVEEKVLDYYTRIYRLVLDSTRTYVKHVISTIGYPTAVPDAAKFNFSAGSPKTPEDKVGIPFKCVGVEVDDPINLLEFNELVISFNPSMADDRREASMVKLKNIELDENNYNGYPRIDLTTNELQWWISKEEKYNG